MTQHRKYNFKIPQSLLNSIEKIATEDKETVDKIVEKAIRLYLREYDELRSGYLAMAEFNQEYAEMCLIADNEVLKACEEKLSESEKCDS